MTPLAEISDFKAQFNREFQYGTNQNQVQDADIQRALNEAASWFNSSLWDDTLETIIAYCYCTAHIMVQNIRESGGLTAENQGLGLDSRGESAVSSKSVGPASVTYILPPSITDSPILSQFLSTGFGKRYLYMLTPRIVGNMYVVEGFREDAGLGDVTMSDQDMLPTGNFNISADQDIAAYGSVVPHYMFYVLDINEQNARIVLPRGGIIQGLVVKVAANTLDGSTVITVLKNGVAQSLTCTFAAGVLSSQDTEHSFILTASDEVSIKVDITASTTGALTAFRATLVLQL